MSAKVLVLYYCSHGSVEAMADAIALGIESANCTAVIRSVPSLNATETAPSTALVTKKDLQECNGIALGTPSRFGQMAAPMKAFWETTSDSWLKGSLIDKPASVFTASASLHGGNEATLLSLALPLLHHGMMLVGLPYSEPELANTTSGGTPYGASHVSGNSNSNQLTAEERSLCIAQGKRLADIAQKLKLKLYD